MNKETRFSKVFLITVIAIGIIFYIYFLRTGKKPAPAPSDIGEEKLPTISFSTSLEKPTSVEEYGMMTEYYNTDDLAELSKNVRIKLTLIIDKAYLIDRITIKRTNGTRTPVYMTIENTTSDPLSSDDKNVIYLDPEIGENMIGYHNIQVSYYTFFDKDTERLGPEGSVVITAGSISLLSVSGNSINLDTKYSSIGNYTENYLEIKSVDSGGNIFEGSDVYFQTDGTDGGFKIMGSDNDNVNGKKFFLINIDGTNWKFQTLANDNVVYYLMRDTSGAINLTSEQDNIKSKLFTITELALFPACTSTVVVSDCTSSGKTTTTTYPKSPNCDNNVLTNGFLKQTDGTFKKEVTTACCKPTGEIGNYEPGCSILLNNTYYETRNDPVFYSDPSQAWDTCNKLASKYPISMLGYHESVHNFNGSSIVVKRSCTQDIPCEGYYPPPSTCQISETNTAPQPCGVIGKKYSDYVLTKAKINNGTCPAARKWEDCPSYACPPPPINCIGAWGVCMPNGGLCGWKGKKTYKVSQKPQNGGAVCKDADTGLTLNDGDIKVCDLGVCYTGRQSSLRLKDNIIKIGEIDGITVYSWTWNAIAMSTYGLKGREVGIIAENLPSDVVITDVYGYMNIREGTWASKLVEKIRDIYPK